MARKQQGWKAVLQNSRTLRGALQSLIAEVQRLASAPDGDAVSGATVLERELAEWNEVVRAAIATSTPLLTGLQRDKKEQQDTLEPRLSKELATRGHVVFGEAGLLIVDGIVHVEVDVAGARTTINGVTSDDLAVPAIATRVSAEVARLREAITPPQAMLETLLQAYEKEIQVGGSQDGAQIRTDAILLQVTIHRQAPKFRSDPSARNYREYGRDLFRADLHTLLASGLTTTRGRRFRHASGADTAGAVFMLDPALGRTAHVGRIWFEAAREDPE